VAGVDARSDRADRVGLAAVCGPASEDACPHAMTAADDECAPVSVLRCLTCREPIGTYYPDLRVWVVSDNASTGVDLG